MAYQLRSRVGTYDWAMRSCAAAMDLPSMSVMEPKKNPITAADSLEHTRPAGSGAHTGREDRLVEVNLSWNTC